jgi:D-alanyl-D-alanine carboxypeptidase
LAVLAIREDFKQTKKITIDDDAVAAEGEAGNLRSGEVYATDDLLKIMLLVSSNDAAKAFENNLGGETFVRALNNKAESLGMTSTIVHDASGLNDLNESTVDDFTKLVAHIAEFEPEILNWTRLSSILVQPVNDTKSVSLTNINSLSASSDFLGGKTGTSDAAKENLAAIFSFRDMRLMVILFGSPDRIKESNALLEWVGKAYSFE